MADFESTMKFNIDLTDYNTGMKQIKQSLSDVNREFRVATAGMDSWSKSSDGLEAKISQLKDKTELYNAQVTLFTEQLEKAKKEFGENSREAEIYKDKLADATVNLKNAQSGVEKYTKKLNEMQSEQKQSVSAFDQLTTEIADQQKKVDDLKNAYKSSIVGNNPAETRKLANELKDASTKLAEMKNKMKDADKAADDLDESIEKTGESAKVAANGGFTVLKGALANLVTQGINRVIDGFKTLARNATSYESEIEGYQISFEVMTGSAQKAADMVEELATIVKKTPFDMPTLADATTLLMNYGFSADEAVDKMMMLGDISQGSSEKLGRIALAYGQMNSAGKVLLQDLKQMIEAGFNPLQEISDSTGESMASLYDRISKGTISVDEINEAFIRATSSGGKYYQSMDKQSQSFKGRLEALQEQANATFGKTLQPFLQQLSDRLIPRATKMLEQMDTTKLARSFADLGDKAVKAFDWMVEHGGEVIEVIKGIAVGFVTFKAVSIINTVVGAFGTLISAIKTGETLMTALNLAFNATPIGLIATGVGVLAGGLFLLAKRAKEATEAEYGLNEEQQKAIDTVAELTNTYNDLNTIRKEQMSDINSEFGYIQELKDEYNGLIDSNGKVKDGYEDRANFILTTLAEAMGMELDDIKKLIEKNGELGASIDKVIEKKKAEAVLAANEEMYNQAIKERATAFTELAEAQKVVKDAEETYTKAQEDSKKVMEEFNRLVGEGRLDAAAKYFEANQGIIIGEEAAKKAFEEATAKVKEAEDAWINYNGIIQNYEGLSAAIISGDAEKINEAMQNMTYNFLTAETGNRESLERQVQNYKDNLANLEQAIKDGTPNVTQEMVNQAKSMVEAAEAELDKLPPEASEKGIQAGKKFGVGLGDQKPLALAGGKELAEGARISITPAIDELGKVGDKAGAEFGDEVGSTENKTNAETSGEDLAEEAVKGASSENGEEGGAKKSGKNFTRGFSSGISAKDVLSGVASAASGLAGWALSALKRALGERSPSRETRKSGVNYGKGFNLGIIDMFGEVQSTASQLGRQAVNALGSNLNDQMREIGIDGGQSLIDGMNSIVPNMSESIGDLKASVASANATMNGTQEPNVGTFAGAGNTTQNVTFNQYNTSPKALSRLDVYRQTNSLLFSAKVRLGNV